MRYFWVGLLVVWAFGGAGAAAIAADGDALLRGPSGNWQIITDTFAARSASAIESLDERGVVATAAAMPALPGEEQDQVAPPSEQQIRIGLDHLLELRAERAAVHPSADDFAVWLRAAAPVGMEHFVGKPTVFAGGKVEWEEAAGGTYQLPLERFVAMRRADASAIGPSGVGAGGTEDVIGLANGDTLHGIVAEIGRGGVVLQQSSGATSGATTTVPLGSVTSINFANVGLMGGATSGPASTGPGPRTWRITLADGAVMGATSLRLAEPIDGWRGRLALGGAVTDLVGAQHVCLIEQLNGPVVWLSSLTPVRVEQSPWLGLAMPPRVDASVIGGPLRFGSRIFAHGWGVHARCVLAFAIDPSYRQFRTSYAIDGEQPYADLTVRIRLDGQVVSERQHFRAGVLAGPVTIDVAGHKELTLEVDYGDTGDVQGRLNWLEPAMLRSPAAAGDTGAGAGVGGPSGGAAGAGNR
jgi:hypothetical protein